MKMDLQNPDLFEIYRRMGNHRLYRLNAVVNCWCPKNYSMKNKK